VIKRCSDNEARMFISSSVGRRQSAGRSPISLYASGRPARHRAARRVRRHPPGGQLRILPRIDPIPGVPVVRLRSPIAGPTSTPGPRFGSGLIGNLAHPSPSSNSAVDAHQATHCYDEENSSGYRMAEVNSRRESRASERDFEPPAPARGEQPSAKNGGILGFSGPIGGRRGGSLTWSWRRERNCQQTLSAAFSMSYELHSFRWVLTRESCVPLAFAPTAAPYRLLHVLLLWPPRLAAGTEDMPPATGSWRSS
jgi:hypothetical protein